MLLHRLRYSAPLGALSRSTLLQIGSNSRVETQLPPTPMASARSSLPNRSFGTSCCPKPAPTGAADAHSASDLGPVPSFLMSRAIRYSQVMVPPASPSFSRLIFPHPFFLFNLTLPHPSFLFNLTLPQPFPAPSCHRSSAQSSITGPSAWVSLAARPFPLLLSAATRARATPRLSSPKSAQTLNPY